jgi:hypothetical protein
MADARAFTTHDRYYTDDTRLYVIVGGEAYSIETDEEEERARAAMHAFELEETIVWFGHPESPRCQMHHRVQLFRVEPARRAA